MLLLWLWCGHAWAAKPDPQAPETYRVHLDTTEGEVVLEVHRRWAPHGADRFHAMVQSGYLDGAPFFRVIKGFMAQFGIAANPEVTAVWTPRTLPDDPVTQSNTRGRVTFATSGPNRRTTQVFVNLADNAFLDAQGFAPFAEVVSGMDAVDALFHRFGDAAPRGRGPDQALLKRDGAAALVGRYRKLDRIVSARVE